MKPKIYYNEINNTELIEKVKKFTDGVLGKDVLKVRNGIVEYMHKIIEFYPEQDNTRKAKKTATEIGKLMRVCDAAIETLVTKGDTIKGAVVYTLFFRYSKRILAHMSNIVTSLFMPLHKLDYFDEVNQKIV